MGYESIAVNRDALTNLLSRSQFLLAVGTHMPSVSSSSIVFINLDRFRQINENFTYAVGDAILQEIARRIVRHVPTESLVSRFSGDEFVVACFNVDSDAAYTLAQRILQAVAEPHQVENKDVVVTASIGVATQPSEGALCERALMLAESAAKRAKDGGRNQVCISSPAVSEEMLTPLIVETMLRNALRNKDLEIYYQPKIQAKSMQVVGAEALCRWRHSEFGEIPPHRFIPVAESSDLILPIDEYVLRAVCEQGARWLQDGYRVRMSVNVSSRQFGQPGFPELVRSILRDTKMDPSLLELEITERTAMHDVDRAVHTLTELRNLGVRIAIDDFGIGYSSLSYLMRFPVHTLKIDRSFTAGIQSAVNQNPVIGAIISLAKSLNLNVVAEGVETVQQFDFLRDNKCDEIQGYLFGEPVPPTSFQLTAFESTPQPRGFHPGQDTLALQLAEYEWLERVGMAALRRRDLGELVSALPDFIVERIPCDRFSIELASEDDRYCLIHEASMRDDIPARIVGTFVPTSKSGLSFIRKTRLPSLCKDILKHPEFPEDYTLSAEGIRSIIRVPLLHGQDVYGMFTLQSSHPDLYNDNDRRLLQRLASRLGSNIYAAYQNEQQRRNAYIDPTTRCFTRGFLSALMLSEDPLTFLEQVCHRPFPVSTDLSLLFLSIVDFERLPFDEGEQAMDRLAELLRCDLGEYTLPIRLNSGDVLLVVLGDAALVIAHLKRQLTEQLHVLHARAERLGDPTQAFDVRVGEATGSLANLNDLYLASSRQAMELPPLCLRQLGRP
ncbi:EAL domain-containing protein [Alicyclobacillus fastidiosus]|uniref:EAL domain-containing protein n=1 Tax=Alicyclobacillus fastidiosus TaxID=392011 RepID=A0ABV5ADG4_9BACL|nr:EAL domain-containing protein [Alicyclobacillus fastidiosus]WEH11220.1 EAL domain-containing protein [Alicyclobacillus fastidiosus]